MAKTGCRDRGPFRLGLVVIGVIAGLVVAGFLIKFSGPPAEPSRPEPSRPEPSTPVAQAPLSGKPPAATIIPKPSLRVAIVIDDMGADLKKVNELFEVDAPLTIAVLPFLRHSKAVATKIHLKKGWEVILHLPMEPKDYSLGDSDKNPGNGALFTTMSVRDVMRQTLDDIKEVPYADGVNNHMGSRFTENAVLMRAALDVMRQNKLFFLDSRTSASTVGGNIAREMGIPNADRSVFLDNTRDENYVKGQFVELVAAARRKGKAIAIGHPYPETIAALKASIPYLREQGVEVVKLSDLID